MLERVLSGLSHPQFSPLRKGVCVYHDHPSPLTFVLHAQGKMRSSKQDDSNAASMRVKIRCAALRTMLCTHTPTLFPIVVAPMRVAHMCMYVCMFASCRTAAYTAAKSLCCSHVCPYVVALSSYYCSEFEHTRIIQHNAQWTVPRESYIKLL